MDSTRWARSLGAIVTTAWLIPTLGTQRAIISWRLIQAALGALAICWLGGLARVGRGGSAAAAAWAIGHRPRLRTQRLALPLIGHLRPARARQAPDLRAGRGWSHHHRAPAQSHRPGDLDQWRERRRHQPGPASDTKAPGSSSGVPSPVAPIGPPDRIRLGRDLLLRQPALERSSRSRSSSSTPTS